MINDRFPAYNGNAPYAFISYAHADSDRIYPIITRLYNEGYRLWYDEGIELSKNYAAEINIHLENCSIFILFVSDTSVTRPDVIDEFAYAKSLKKPMLFIHLDDIDISSADAAMRGEITTKQGILWHALADEERQRKLRDMLFACVGDAPEVSVPVPAEKKADAKFSLLQKASSFMSLREYPKAYDAYSEFAAQYPNEYVGHWGMVLSETKNFTDLSIGSATFDYIQKHSAKAISHAPDSEKEELSSAWNCYAEKIAAVRAAEAKKARHSEVKKGISKVVSEVIYCAFFAVSFLCLAFDLLIYGISGATFCTLVGWLAVGIIIAVIMRFSRNSRLMALMPKILCIASSVALLLPILFDFTVFSDEMTSDDIGFNLLFVGIAVLIIAIGIIISKLLKKNLPEKKEK